MSELLTNLASKSHTLFKRLCESVSLDRQYKNTSIGFLLSSNCAKSLSTLSIGKNGVIPIPPSFCH